jgi:tripartite-type tricarboxylate transporter receptor subunit TctC
MKIIGFGRCLAAASLALFLLSGHDAKAQAGADWPQKPVNLIVPFAAGGGTDAFARPFAAWLESRTGQRVLIENKAGAGGTVGASAAAKAPADGYTFLVGAAHHAIAPALYPKLDYMIDRDFEPVGILAVVPQVVVANPDKVKAKSLAELVAEVKAAPGKFDYGSAGHGTTHHLAGELFKLVTRTEIVHVPYRGAGPAMQDLVAGHIHLMFDGLGSSAEQISAGKLRALAVADSRRNDLLKDVPTAKEAGVDGYEVTTWYAIFAPKGTPPAAVARMTELMKEASASDRIKEIWGRNGSIIPNVYGADMRDLLASEILRWGKVVREANVKLQ